MKLDDLTDVLYEVDNGLAWITINRPHRYNSFTNRTIDELICAFKAAWADPKVGVLALTGAGDKAFCTGGDQKQRKETGNYGPMETGVPEIEYFHRLIREVPKPVIAAVNGFAIGGGHVLHVLCDLTIAADHARFGQTGPRVGSFDAGFGSAYLARIVGDKRGPGNLVLLPSVRCRHHGRLGAGKQGGAPCRLEKRSAALGRRYDQQEPDGAEGVEMFF